MTSKEALNEMSNYIGRLGGAETLEEEEIILKDLEVLEMLRGIIQVYCVKRKRNNLYILASKNLSLTEEEYKKIKEWLNNE